MPLYIFSEKHGSVWIVELWNIFLSIYLKFKNYSRINMCYTCNKIGKKSETFDKRYSFL